MGPSLLAVRRNYRVLCIKIDLLRLKRALDGVSLDDRQTGAWLASGFAV